MQINQRVCAILITNAQEIVLVKRAKNDFSSYWVAPGGWVETTDRSLEAALLREVEYETGGTAQVVKPLLFLEHIIEEDVVVKQWFYLCLLDDAKPISPHNDYVVERFPLKRDTLKTLNIQPPKLKAFLIENYDQLTALPAVRY